MLAHLFSAIYWNPMSLHLFGFWTSQMSRVVEISMSKSPEVLDGLLSPKPCCKPSFLLCSFGWKTLEIQGSETNQFLGRLDLNDVVNLLVFFNDFISEGQRLRVFWSCWTVTTFTGGHLTGCFGSETSLKLPAFFWGLFACNQVSSEFKDQLSSLMAWDLSSKQRDPNKKSSKIGTNRIWIGNVYLTGSLPKNGGGGGPPRTISNGRSFAPPGFGVDSRRPLS